MKLNDIPHYKSALLLQGPVGPFFCKLSKFLKSRETEVLKVNFNFGDDIFYSGSEIVRFKDEPEQLYAYYKTLIQEHNIEAIFLFGDRRPIHVIALEVAKELLIDTWIFEEGYIRPGYYTLETSGAGALSSFPQIWKEYDESYVLQKEDELNAPVKFSSIAMTTYAAIYYIAEYLGRSLYPQYNHHKKFCFYELALLWPMFIVNKFLYKTLDHKLKQRIIQGTQEYFVAILQVALDFSVLDHSDYNSIEDFIIETVETFAMNAHKDHLLVIKHHPMDRSLKNYTSIIKQLAKKHQITERVIYLRETNTLQLIKGSNGVVVINSTVGLQALYHNIPLKVMGRAFYDIPDLTHQGNLESFFKSPTSCKEAVFCSFRNLLIQKTQIQGSLYAGDIIND